MEKTILIRLHDIPRLKKLTMGRAISNMVALGVTFLFLVIVDLPSLSQLVFVPALFFCFYDLCRCGIRWNNLLECEMMLKNKLKKKLMKNNE